MCVSVDPQHYHSVVNSAYEFKSSVLSTYRDNGVKILGNAIFQKRLAKLVLNHKYWKGYKTKEREHNIDSVSVI